MKDNLYKNEHESNIEELDSLIILLESLNKDIELYALGGTAMVLANYKPSTRDIDFLTTLESSEIKNLFGRIGLEEIDDNLLCNKWRFNKKRLDIFYSKSDMILGFPLTLNWKSNSRLFKQTKKVKIYILNWEDIISSKLARGEHRDFEDILKILEKEKIDFERFKKDFIERAEICAGNTNHCLENLKHLERELKNA